MSTPGLRFGQGIERTRAIQIEVDGQMEDAYEGETIAAALLAAGKLAFHTTEGLSTRGIYCGMGLCHGCLVTVNGVPNVRACVTLVEPGLRVETQIGPGTVKGALYGGG